MQPGYDTRHDFRYHGVVAPSAPQVGLAHVGHERRLDPATSRKAVGSSLMTVSDATLAQKPPMIGIMS